MRVARDCLLSMEEKDVGVPPFMTSVTLMRVRATFS